MRGGVALRIIVFVLPLLIALPVAAGPRTIDDCEAIKDANAYNLCLASFGPVRGQHGASYPGMASEGEKESGRARGNGTKAVPARRAASALGYGARVTHGRSGRMRMEFAPGRR